ncbi:hypothetical protein [Salinibacterium sp. ZJ454]|uniref:hypothetical protein n=1 Tax=Salinibacterium sp. ZJ454 TaxID=2708339 RepID=UPI0014202180|nr:hypothetical protein [Salinibacterium sp. ZJ454]
MTDAPAITPTPNRARVLVLKSIVASVIGAALVAVVSVLVGEFAALSWRLLGTVMLFVVFSLMSWYDAEVSAKRAAWFGFASAGVSVYLFAAGMLKIWFPAASSSMIEDFLAWGWIVLVARIALLHVHLLIVQQTKFTTPVMSGVTTVTFGLVVILAAMLSLPALLPDPTYEEWYWRILFAVAILDVLGTVLIPLVYVLFHRPARPVAQPYYPAAVPAYPGQSGYPAPAPQQGYAPVATAQQGYAPVATAQQGYAPVATAQAEYGVPVPQAYPQPVVAQPAAAQPTAGYQAGFIAPDAAPPVPPFTPPVAQVAAPVLPQAQPLQLEWPRYTTGQPVHALPNGLPDLNVPAGALAWPRYTTGQPVPALPDGSPDLSATLS